MCDEIGRRLTSSLSYSMIFDNTNGIRATRGQRITLGQDFAGLGGDVRYIRSRLDATKYFQLPAGFVFSAHGEGGYIHPLQKAPGVDRDPVRITDRFFGAQMRGFDIRGIGPRVRRTSYDANGALVADSVQDSDALGGKAFYMGRAELEFPMSSKLRSLGLRPSAFVDVGSVWGLTRPKLNNILAFCTPLSTNPTGVPRQVGVGDAPCDTTLFSSAPGYTEEFIGNSPKPRLSVGIGVNWVSPFGPLRLDLAKALLHQDGDKTKFFSFNVGTQF